MIPVIRQLAGHIKENDHAGGHPHSQPGDVDERESLMLSDIPQCDFNVIE
jgi:hypothetical protein